MLFERTEQASLAVCSLYIMLGLGVTGTCVNVIIVNVLVTIRSAARSMGVVEMVDEDGDGVDDNDAELLRKLDAQRGGIAPEGEGATFRPEVNAVRAAKMIVNT